MPLQVTVEPKTVKDWAVQIGSEKISRQYGSPQPIERAVADVQIYLNTFAVARAALSAIKGAT